MKVGKVPETVLKRSVLKQLHTKRKEVKTGAGVGKDCAVFAVGAPGEAVLFTCMGEAAVALGSEVSIGSAEIYRVSMPHLIQKCVNNLAAAGAQPFAVLISLLLPEEAGEPYLKQLMREAEEACASLSLQIAGGQTRVSPGVNQPLAVITGYGLEPEEGLAYPPSKAVPGQDIVLSKWIGLEGTAMLAGKYREGLLDRYPAFLVEEAAGFHRFLSVLPEAAVAVKTCACAMHDASEGGIFAALWELAESAGVGLTVDLKKLPIRQETVEICEFCGVNPYELLSGGCMVIAAEDGEALAEALSRQGIFGTVVGKITDSNDRLVWNGDEARYLERP